MKKETKIFVEIELIHSGIERTSPHHITKITGIPDTFDLRVILKDMKREFGCSGTLKDKVIFLLGDKRRQVWSFLINNDICIEG